MTCACGCGQSTNPENPVARYVAGHQLGAARAARGPRNGRRAQPCECGCGRMAARYSRFVDHHGNRGVKRGEGRYINNVGYAMLRMPEHPDAVAGYVREHRWVMEQALGRRLLKAETVHHLNHVKTDNRPENLVILTRHAHGAEHGRPVGIPVTAAQRAALSERTARVWAERRAGVRPMPTGRRLRA